MKKVLLASLFLLLLFIVMRSKEVTVLKNSSFLKQAKSTQVTNKTFNQTLYTSNTSDSAIINTPYLLFINFPE